MRLQKFLADAGIASRRQCETYIADGRITVNGETATLGRSVDPLYDAVLFDGKPVLLEEERLVILFYKPRGVVSTSSDPQHRKTVQDFFSDIPQRLYNVGRLDINSEGLLIMTNNGELANRLTHPRYKIRKTYFAVCDGELTGSEAARLMQGVQLDDGMTAPAVVDHIRKTKTGQTSFHITIREGRNRQVRRMLEAVGHRTLLLKRERIGALTLGDLRPGEWRYATDEELAWLSHLPQNDKEKL